MRGIVADDVVSTAEVEALRSWLLALGELRESSAFREIADLIDRITMDGVVNSEELEDLRWLLGRWTTPDRFYDAVTADLHRLHGMIAGFLADGRLTDGEIQALADWLDERDQLVGAWPYDEINAALTHVLEDGVVTEEERGALADFLAAHIPTGERAVVEIEGLDARAWTLDGVCAANVGVQVRDRRFCLTGKSARKPRDEVHAAIERGGGAVLSGVSGKLNYLVVGADGNPCWAFAAYGRKVEQAMKLRRQGEKLLIVHETDLWDALGE